MTTPKKVHLTSTTTSTSPPTPVSRFREAYDRLAPAMWALDADGLAIVNLDLASAATTVIGAVPELLAHRAEIVEKLPRFDVACLDSLESYALAAVHAQAMYIAAATPSPELAALADEAMGLRETLFADASTLARHRLVDGQRLSQLKGSTGYKNVALDLVSLAGVLREAWPQVEGKTAVDAALLDRAETLADRIIKAVGAREQAPAVVAEVAQMRQRAFTLLVRAYDEVRRAMSFLRWNQGDLDTIAPSLYGGRSARRGKSDVTEGVASGATTGTTAPPSPVEEPGVAPGLPGGDPFQNKK